MKSTGRYFMHIFAVMAITSSILILSATMVMAENEIKCDWKDIPPITLKLTHGDKIFSASICDVERYHNGGDGICLGLASGFRACQIGLAALYPEEKPTRGDQFVVIGTPRVCPADAITYVTGARYGKGAGGAFNGNIAFDKSVGDFNFIFVRMSTGKAVKLVNRFQTPKEFFELKTKSEGNPNDLEIKAKFAQMSDTLARKVLTAPEKEVFEVTPIADFSWKNFKDNYLK